MSDNQDKHNDPIVMSPHVSQEITAKDPTMEQADTCMDNIQKSPPYLSQPEDECPSNCECFKKVGGRGSMIPWVTGRTTCSSKDRIAELRPIADRYSITRFEPREWRAHNLKLFQQSNSEIHDAQSVTSDAKNRVKQIYAATDKTQLETTEHLKTRANLVYRWKTQLEHAIVTITEEIGLLIIERRRVKQSMSILAIPTSIAGEFLQLRSSRLEADLVHDEVEKQLSKELALCAEILDLLNRTCEQIDTQMNELKTIKGRMESDWSDKIHTYDIDSVCVNLSNDSSIILWKAGATRFPTEQSTPTDYDVFTRETLTAGEIVRQKSRDLRSTLNTTYTNFVKDLNDQATRVNIVLAEKIKLTQDVIQHLERELLRCLNELANTEKLIEQLRNSMKRLNSAMKLTQTRLDNRLTRRNMENCQDTPQIALIEEVKSLGERISTVLAKLQCAEESQAKLIRTRNELEHEIMVKRKTLYIDKERGELLRSFFPSTVALSGFS